MVEECYKILESLGWVREMEESNWVGYHSRTVQSSGGTMIINGRRIDSPPEITKIEIEYKGDGWVENSDGTNRQDTTLWDIRIIKGDFPMGTTVIIYSPEQFLETIKELGL